MTVKNLLGKNKEIMDLLEDRVCNSILHSTVGENTTILKHNIVSALSTINSNPSSILKDPSKTSKEDLNNLKNLLKDCLDEISKMETESEAA